MLYSTIHKPVFGLNANMFSSIIPIVLFTLVGAQNLLATNVPESRTISTRTMSLEQRYNDPFVNGVFKDNILLTLAYLRDIVNNTYSVDWEEVRKPFNYEVVLRKGEVFSYHEDTLPEYKNVVKTTGAHFGGDQGFKSDGYLMGDGVCHLASLIYWAAIDAGLEAKSPTNHNFAKIPQIPAEYGVSIYFMPGSKEANAAQNLYVKNTLEKDVTFKFNYDGDNLTVKVLTSK